MGGRQNINSSMRLQDRQELRGILEYKVYRHRGNNVKELVEESRRENLIVNGARNQMARLIAGIGRIGISQGFP
jgi:hypothetical protein